MAGRTQPRRRRIDKIRLLSGPVNRLPGSFRAGLPPVEPAVVNEATLTMAFDTSKEEKNGRYRA